MLQFIINWFETMDTPPCFVVVSGVEVGCEARCGAQGKVVSPLSCLGECVCVGGGGRGLMWSSGNDGSSLHVTNTIVCVLLAWAWFAKAIVVIRKNQPLPKPCTEKKRVKV